MKIHWWSTEAAVDQLANDGVSELDFVRYAIIGVALYWFAIHHSIWFGGDRTWLLAFEFFVVALIGMVGVRESFKANGGSEGSDFLKRFGVISVPVSLKVTVVSMILGQLAYFGFPVVVTHETFRDPEHVYRLFCFALAATIQFIFYWRMATHICRLNKIVQSLRPEAQSGNVERNGRNRADSRAKSLKTARLPAIKSPP